MSIDSTIITIVFVLLIMYYMYICVLAVLVKAPPEVAGGEEDMRFIFLIPCRNEEAVIGVTIKRLLETDHPHKEILVINDGSTDDTEGVVKAFIDTGAVDVVTTEDPGRGKGEALNFGFRKMLGRLREEGASHYEKIVIGILDADGQPSVNICRAVEPYFTDPDVGAIQAAVRIANADTNLIAACQDVEFTGFSQSIQKGRDRLGSVGLGGNGQFVRLSALCSLSLESPWNQSLTEDLDIGMRLIRAGWKIRFCSRAWVAQQGVEKVRPLVVQRVRWMQGHYSCWKYIPGLVTNRNLPWRTRLDNSAYLVLGVTPFIVLLSILFSLLAAIGAITVTNGLTDFLLGTNFILFIFMFYFLSFIIAIIFVTFYVRYKKMSIWRLIFLYHVFAFYTLLWIPASMGAVINLMRGETVWVKTGRTAVEEFVEIRRHPRVEFETQVEMSGEGEEIVVTVSDLAAGGAGILLTKKYFADNAIRLVSTGNRVEVIAPVSGKRVRSEVVWVAYLGFNQVRAGLQFMEPGTIDPNRDFGYPEKYHVAHGEAI